MAYLDKNDNVKDFNGQEALNHLSYFIQCQSVSYPDTSKVNLNEFKKIHEGMFKFYPHILKEFSYEIISGGSILWHYTCPQAKELPILLMAHLDVVPVDQGSLNEWVAGPFEGKIVESKLYGRGAWDIKNLMCAEMETIEYLLAHGYKPKRDIYLAYGQDEETLGGLGHEAIAQLLYDRGVRCAFVMDEGGGFEGCDKFNTTCDVATISLQEKGYLDIIVEAFSEGGHSSNPGNGTTLESVSKAISQICASPFNEGMPHITKMMLEALKPYQKGPLNANTLKLYQGTTKAPTMLEGASATPNVLPKHIKATINCRLSPLDTPDDIIAIVQERTQGLDVVISKGTHIEASLESNYANKECQLLVQHIHNHFKDVAVIPQMTIAGTDARFYEKICDCCCRFAPFRNDPKEAMGMHTVNEHIGCDTFIDGINFLIDFVKELAF